MNKYIFYEITTHLENPKDCLSLACVCSEYSEFWKECPSLDSEGKYFRSCLALPNLKVRFSPKELALYERILYSQVGDFRVFGLSKYSHLLLLYCLDIMYLYNVPCFYVGPLRYESYLGFPIRNYRDWDKKEVSIVRTFNTVKRTNYCVLGKNEAIIFGKPLPLFDEAKVNIEYWRPKLEVIGVIDPYLKEDKFYELVEESCDDPDKMAWVHNASEYTTDILLNPNTTCLEKEIDRVYNEHCRPSKLTVWIRSDSVSVVHLMCLPELLLENFKKYTHNAKFRLDGKVHIDNTMLPGEILAKTRRNVPQFILDGWYKACGYSLEGIANKKRSTIREDIQVIGPIPADIHKVVPSVTKTFFHDPFPATLMEVFTSQSIDPCNQDFEEFSQFVTQQRDLSVIGHRISSHATRETYKRELRKVNLYCHKVMQELGIEKLLSQ